MDQVGLDDVLQLQPRSHKVPIVVHNGLMDILFLLSHCFSTKLPDTFKECKSLIATQFPLIYDTKVMATEGPTRHENTVLSQLFSAVVPEAVAANIILQETSTSAQIHEASHDAYMTGALFYGLSIQAADNGVPLWDVHYERTLTDNRIRNKLYLMLTMFTIDLENPNEDPLSRGMQLDSTYRVTGSDPSVSTRDVVRCLTSVTSPFSNSRIHFEVIWVDDTTFMVAARDEDSDRDRMVVHGKLISKALKERFTLSRVESLADILQRKEGREKIKKRKSWSFWSWFGFGIRDDDEEEEYDRPWKRRRLE
jgi:hypothetical protein